MNLSRKKTLTQEEKERISKEAIQKIRSKKKYKSVTWRSFLRLFGIRA